MSFRRDNKFDTANASESLTLLEFKQQNTDGKENEDPNARGDETEVHVRVVDGPTSLCNGAKRLGGFCERQEEGRRFEQGVHALNWPDDSAEHDERQERAQRHVRCAPLVVNCARDYET